MQRIAIWALTICLALIGNSWGQSQRPSPGEGKSVELSHTQSSEPNKDTTSDPRGTDHSPLVVKVVPTAETAERAAADARRENEKTTNDSRIARFTERLFWATVALSIIAFFQFIAFLWQGWQLQRTVSLGNAEFIATHRPHLVIRFVDLIKTGENKDKQAIEFNIMNIGQSNATVVGSSINAELLDAEAFPNPLSYPVNNIVPERRFLPGATDRYTFTTLEVAKADLFQVHYNTSNRLKFYGYIVYQDDAGNSRTTFFFRRYRGGPAFRNRMAAWLRWILGLIMPPISPRLPA